MAKASSNTSPSDGAPDLPRAGQVRIGPVAAIASILRELDQDLESICADCGLDPEVVKHADNIVSFNALGRLVALCAKRTGVPHFGLLIGQRAALASLGPLEELAQHAPDVETALRAMIQHHPVHDRASTVSLLVDNGVATIQYALYEPDVAGIEQICDGSIAIICNVMRALCGSTWAPAEVLFSHSRPADITPYRRFFRAQLRFDMDQTALVFPRHWLRTPLPNPNTELHQSLEQRLTDLLSGNPDDILSELRRIVRAQFAAGRKSREHIAEHLSLHRRTFNRRLKEHGINFRQLLQEVRFEYAKQLLSNTRTKITDIATTLGYSDASAFSRAFRRWSGMTPAAWRTARK